MIRPGLDALAEPTRLSAMRILHGRGAHCVCDLMQRLDATQSRMSWPVQVQKQAGLVVALVEEVMA